jgi:hypothetical protein
MDCPICYDKKPCLKALPCDHSLCSKCYLRLDKSTCPYCRTEFIYSVEENKQRVKLGLESGYQSNNTQPGLELPDEFIFDRPVGLLPNFSSGLNLSPDLISRRNQRIENHRNNLEDGLYSTRSKRKNKKYDFDTIPSRLSEEEIFDRRYNIAKRESRKWTRKDRRLEKINAGLVYE